MQIAKNKVPSERPALTESPAAILPEPNKVQPLPRLAYTMKETAEIIGVNYFTVHRLLKRGLLRSSSALRTKLIPATEINRFLQATLS